VAFEQPDGDAHLVQVAGRGAAGGRPLNPADDRAAAGRQRLRRMPGKLQRLITTVLVVDGYMRSLHDDNFRLPPTELNTHKPQNLASSKLITRAEGSALPRLEVAVHVEAARDAQRHAVQLAVDQHPRLRSIAQ